MTTATRLIEVLSRRHDTLRSLLDAPKERHVLVDHLDDSKSTVYKGVSQLQELRLVESTEEGLQPTLFGIVALERYDELARTADLEGLLAELPPGTVDPSALVGAETVVPDGTAVERHLRRIETMLRSAESIRAVSPAVSPRYLSLLRRRIGGGELAAEFVLTGEIVTHLRRERPEVIDDVRAADHAALYQTREELPFTLLLVSTAGGAEVGIELGEAGLATGVLVNDTPEALRWAEATYERYKRNAARVTT